MTPVCLLPSIFLRTAAALTLFCTLFVQSALSGQPAYQILKSFGFGPQSTGSNPHAGVIQASDAALYGTTYSGGASNGGTIFRVSVSNSSYQVIHHFNAAQGRNPYAGVIEGSDGALYGATTSGGAMDAGTVFNVNRDGSAYSVLHDFSGGSDDGKAPYGSLIEGTDGTLYGTTSAGGPTNAGTVFKIRKDGTQYEVLHYFTGQDGRNPYARLLEAWDGNLYGTTYFGGGEDVGVIFSLGKDGSNFRILISFSGWSARYPQGWLIQGSDGILYGTTAGGGAYQFDVGTAYRIRRDGSEFFVVLAFGGDFGRPLTPIAGLLEGAGGALYGTTISVGGSGGYGTVYRFNKDGTGFTVLYSAAGQFTGFDQDAGLITARDGFLYSTASRGGVANAGILYRLRTDGSEYSPLMSFQISGGDGQEPRASLLGGTDGRLYGTTYKGGHTNAGAVFRCNTDGSATEILHSFDWSMGGRFPGARLLKANDGFLYGTTSAGGSNNLGVIFKLGTDGSDYTVLWHFQFLEGGGGPVSDLVEGSDGKMYGVVQSAAFGLNRDGSDFAIIHKFDFTPGGGLGPVGLIEATDGFLYGTTSMGGSASRGAVFKLSKDGSVYRVLRNFQGTNDGNKPQGRVVEGRDGMLYGTTFLGGETNAGTVFRVGKEGENYSLLHSFSVVEGKAPYGDLVEGLDGVFFGTTSSGGITNAGIVFRLNKDGSGFRVLHKFQVTPGDGRIPYAGLSRVGDDRLYGTTSQGGDFGIGTIFALNPQPTISTATTDVSKGIVVRVYGLPGFTYRIDAIGNLSEVGWVSLGNGIAAPGGMLEFQDQDSPNHVVRFYRAVEE